MKICPGQITPQNQKRLFKKLDRIIIIIMINYCNVSRCFALGKNVDKVIGVKSASHT